MAARFPSARHQAALSTPTGYRRWSRFTFSRQGEVRVLEPTGGRITQDARRAGRWDGNLTFVGDDLIPRSPRDLLTPFGTLVEVELGLELLDGSISSVPYGTFMISSSKTNTTPSARTVQIGLTDVSQRVEGYRFEYPLTIGALVDLGTMINRVIINRLGLSPNVPTVGQTLGTARSFGLDPQMGPWEEILDVLKPFSRTAWYNRAGQVQVGSTTANAASAYPLDSLTSFGADFDTQPPNVIVARGETAEGPAPVIGVALDSDPSSPTYAGANVAGTAYGRRTEYFSSPLLTSNAMALAAAQTILAGRVGAGATYELSRPYDPTIDAGDVVTSGGSTYVVDAISLNLDGDTSMQVREL